MPRYLLNHSFLQRVGVIVIALTIALSTPLHADVLVSPLRVYLDSDQRTATVTLRNPSNGPRTYRLEWLEQKMAENGAYVAYSKEELKQHAAASPYLRLSPRQITVPAQGNQLVRIHYRPNNNMSAGEYRSHLLFRIVPELSEPHSVSEIDGGEGITLKLNMQLSIAIPIVVRHQITEPPNVTISEVKPILPTTQGERAQLAITLKRSGLGGSIGRVVVEMQRSPNSPVQRIGLSDNVSVYADMHQRRLVLNLNEASIPNGAWLRIAYEGIDEYSGRLWNQQIFQVR